MLRFVFAALALTACAAPSQPSAPTAPVIEMVETAPGVSLHVERYGEGPDVVIAPGGLFMPQMARLVRADRTLVLYDMRNRGASAPVTDASLLNIERDVEDVEALRLHFGAERVSLIGYSYLGLMTAVYASRHPERVARLVQIGPAPRRFGTDYAPEYVAGDETLPPEAMEALRAAETAFAAATAETDQAELCRLQRAYSAYAVVGDPARRGELPDPCVYPNEWPAALSRHFASHFADIQTRDYPREMFSGLALPVLTIHGTLDRNAPYGAGREWAGTFPDGRLITVPGAAHSAWIDDPTVIDDIDAFLDGRWPDRAERIAA